MTAEDVASLRAARAARASVVATVRAGGGGVSGSTLRGYGISKTKTGSYKYYDPAKKGYVTTKPAEVKTAEVKVEPKAEYYYDPATRVATTRRIEGQRPMTKTEVLSVIKHLPRETKIEYGRQYGEYTKAKQDVQRAELSSLAEPISLREALAPQVSPQTKATKYEPTFLGGMSLALVKGREVVAKAKEKYVAYTPPSLVPVTKTAIDFEKQLRSKLKFEEVKDIGIKAKEKVSDVKVVKHPLIQDVKQFVGVIPKGFQWAKKEFLPEIKSEAQRFKGIRDWSKDMEKIEDVFLKARKGYVFAEAKAKEWKPQPIVKQPSFLKGVDPYKEFRAQTKKQVVGAAQIGKVTMGATAGVVEDIKVKPYKLPLIYATGVVAGPVAAKFLGAGKVAKVAAVSFGAALATGVGAQVAITPSGLEREKVIGVKAAEIAAFISGAKYGIEKKPLAELYKSRIREPRFEKAYKVWEKGITAKKWTYLEKRAFIPSKKIPQRTLFGEPISPTKIKWLRAEVRPGYYGMDIARYKVTGYDTKFAQKLVTDVYKLKTIGYTKPKLFRLPKPIKKVSAIITKPTKAIDWRQQKVIDLGMKDRVVSQMLTAEPTRFTVIDKPKIRLPLYQRVEALRAKEIPKWPEIQKPITSTYVLGKDWKVIKIIPKPTGKVTKYDRPFYLTKPKIPKPVKLGKPGKITPVHVTEPKPVKVKAADLISTVSVRPVVTTPTPAADVGAVLGTIPKGEALAGAVALSGMRFGVRDLSGALQSQFGAARQRAEQNQASKLGQELEKATKQAVKQTAKQVAKTKPVVKVVPKLTPIVKVIPILKIPTKQIPKLRQPVPTIPFFPRPTYPVHKEPKIPIKRVLLVMPKFEWPRGRFYPTARKAKKLKPFHKYQPSLVALGKKITTKQMPMPKYLTGVGIRPIKF